MKQPQALRWYLIMGLAMGVSVTAKYTTVILSLETVLVFTVLAQHRRYNWQWLLKHLSIVGICAVFASSWWFAWNLWYLNTVDEMGWVSGLLTPFATGGSDITLARLGYFFSGGQTGVSGISEGKQLGSFTSWTSTTFYSFWGVGFGGFLPLFYYAYGIIALMIVTSVFGVYRLWHREPYTRKWLVLLLFHISIFFVFPLLRFTLSRRIGETAQGRHILIPAAAAVVVLIVWGMSAAVSKKWQRWVFPVIVAGSIVWTGAHLRRFATASADVLPLRTTSEAAGWFPSPIGARFGENIELVSYDLTLDSEQGLMQLDLGWRSLEYVSENYLLRVDLVDEKGQSVSQWTGYNADGRLPTLTWDPGDAVFDRLVLPLPNLVAGDYQVQLQLLGISGPLSINDGEDDSLSLAEIALREPTQFSFPQNIYVTDSGGPTQIDFAIWQSDGPVKATETELPYFRYPATISIVLDSTKIGDTQLDVQLVDANGREWQATQAAANIFTFVIGPRWQSGEYRLQISTERGEKSVSEPLVAVENWWLTAI